MRTFIILVAIIVFSAVGHSQTTWYVPDDFPAGIQAAISDPSVVNGDTIIVRPGTYVENIDYVGKTITLQGEQGPANTVIDGSSSGTVVTFANGEGPGSILKGFTITNGYAFRGGGIYCDGSAPTLTNNTIRGNVCSSTADYHFGGGICCNNDSSPFITKNIITENTATIGGNQWNGGAGIAVIYGSKATIHENIIMDNDAHSLGGGIAFFNSTVSPSTWSSELVHNIFAGNTAMRGGVIYTNKHNVTITNCTFCGNAAYTGGCIHLDSSDVYTIKNSIFYNNSSGSYGDEFYNGYSTLNISYSDVEGGLSAVYGAVNWGPDMFDSDPLFVDPVNGDFHLTWLSPCINRGTMDGAPLVDMDGDPRPYMGSADVGVDEFIGSHALEADVFTLTETSGGTVNFSLAGGAPNGSRTYLILGSVTGTGPGTPLPGGNVTLPLNWDFFTGIVIDSINTPAFQNFMGPLSPGSSTATAVFNTFGAIPGAAGLTFSFAYVLKGTPWDFVSNPINIEILP